MCLASVILELRAMKGTRRAQVKGREEENLGIDKGKNKHILPHSVAPDPALLPGSQSAAMLLQATRPGMGICASHLNDESEARGTVRAKVGLGSRCLGSNLSSSPSPAGCHVLFILVWHNGASL